VTAGGSGRHPPVERLENGVRALVVRGEDDGECAGDLALDRRGDPGVVGDDGIDARRARKALECKVDPVDGGEDRPPVGRLAELLGELVAVGRGDEDVSQEG